VLEIAGDLDDETTRLEEQFDGNYGLGQATVAAGRIVEAMTIFEEAVILARKIGSAEKVALCALSFDHAQFAAGQSPQASITLLREAMDWLPGDGANLRCQILSRLGRAHRMCGDEERGLAYEREAILLARKL